MQHLCEMSFLSDPVYFQKVKSRCDPVVRELSGGPENPGLRLAWVKMRATFTIAMHSNGTGKCKIRLGYNVLQIPILIIPLGVPKQLSHSLRGGL